MTVSGCQVSCLGLSTDILSISIMTWDNCLLTFRLFARRKTFFFFILLRFNNRQYIHCVPERTSPFYICDNLSNLSLKLFTDSALTTISGRLFHRVLTQLVKQNLRREDTSRGLVLFCICYLW